MERGPRVGTRQEETPTTDWWAGGETGHTSRDTRLAPRCFSSGRGGGRDLLHGTETDPWISHQSTTCCCPFAPKGTGVFWGVWLRARMV